MLPKCLLGSFCANADFQESPINCIKLSWSKRGEREGGEGLFYFSFGEEKAAMEDDNQQGQMFNPWVKMEKQDIAKWARSHSDCSKSLMYNNKYTYILAPALVYLSKIWATVVIRD